MAWDAYIYGSVARMDLTEATHGALWTLLPPIEPESPPEPPPGDPRPTAETEPVVELPPWLGLGAEPGRIAEET
jgi:hypothetical protein